MQQPIIPDDDKTHSTQPQALTAFIRKFGILSLSLLALSLLLLFHSASLFWLVLMIAFGLAFANPIKHPKKKSSDILVRIISGVGFLLCLAILIFSIYTTYYKKGHQIGIVHTKERQYLGYIIKQPFMNDMAVYTTPKYPILNCPVFFDNCTQELIYIDKDDVLDIEILEDRYRRK